MKTEQIIEAAKKYAESTGNSSAFLRYQDSLHLMERNLVEYARKAAVDSLAHSVGIFHPVYRRANLTF